MASNVEATKKGYECFQRGDIPSLIRDLLDDNCIWISPGPSDKLPWAGTFKGKQEIANFFAHVGEHLEFSEFAPSEMIEQGDTVVVLGTLAGRAKKTGKAVKNEWRTFLNSVKERWCSFRNTSTLPRMFWRCLNAPLAIPQSPRAENAAASRSVRLVSGHVTKELGTSEFGQNGHAVVWERSH
jgi:ketosteroid isomerase-like protein